MRRGRDDLGDVVVVAQLGSGHTPATTALDALGTAATLRAAGYTPANGATYPGGALGDALRDTARLVKAGVGLRAATIDGARYLGMDREIGSLEPGKLADLIVLDANPLEDIRNTESIHWVIANGRVFDSRTMNEVGNHPRQRKPFFWELERPFSGKAAGAER